MPRTIWPIDAVSGSPLYSGKMLRQAMSVLLGGSKASRPLGGRTGIRPGTTGALVTVTSTTWTVQPHAGSLDLETSNSAGPYFYAIDDTANTGSLTAADPTNSRIDIVYVTSNDPSQADGSSVPDVAFGYLAGTPGSSPSAPAAPAGTMVLAQITVPPVGGGSPTSTNVAPFTAAAGATIPVNNQAERDAMTAYDGLQVYRLDTHEANTYVNGSWTSGSWISYSPNWTQVGGSGLSIGNGTLTGWYKADGKRVTYMLTLTRGSTSNVGTAAYIFDLPLQASDLNFSGHGCVVQSGNEFPIIARGLSSTGFTLIQCSNNTRVASSSPASPSWGSGDTIQATITYRAA